MPFDPHDPEIEALMWGKATAQAEANRGPDWSPPLGPEDFPGDPRFEVDESWTEPETIGTVALPPGNYLISFDELVRLAQISQEALTSAFREMQKVIVQTTKSFTITFDEIAKYLKVVGFDVYVNGQHVAKVPVPRLPRYWVPPP